jgi:hypothetical protein
VAELAEKEKYLARDYAFWYSLHSQKRLPFQGQQETCSEGFFTFLLKPAIIGSEKADKQPPNSDGSH